jgi:hypothetical protein
MIRLFIYCLAACLISACASTQKTQAELEKVTFIDVDIFDQELSASMSAKTEKITVSMLAPVSINEIPERLSKDSDSDSEGLIAAHDKNKKQEVNNVTLLTPLYTEKFEIIIMFSSVAL